MLAFEHIAFAAEEFVTSAFAFVMMQMLAESQRRSGCDQIRIFEAIGIASRFRQSADFNNQSIINVKTFDCGMSGLDHQEDYYLIVQYDFMFYAISGRMVFDKIVELEP